MLRRLFGLKAYPRLRCHAQCRSLFRGGAGLEIGGPSHVFKRHGLLPLYPYVGHLDNCNFGGETVWEGRISAGDTFRFHKRRRPGRQYIAEAADLKEIASARYDFVLSSHMIEHAANPLKVLEEWSRVLKDNGHLLLVLPHREGTFDHRRPVTTLAHLIEDYERRMTEADLTHLPEILELTDLSMDPDSGDAEVFRQRCENNVQNRCLHHHVFDTRLAVELVARAGLKILAVETALPHHIFILTQKPGSTLQPDNGRFSGAMPEYRLESCFATDRMPEQGSADVDAQR